MKFLNKKGQGLLEAVFAIAIILIVVSAVLALASSAASGQKQSELQIVANNLAREGIEAVRNIRDSNWLAERDWDEGLFDQFNSSNITAGAVYNVGTSEWSLNFNLSNAPLYQDANGLYTHNPAAIPSFFRRGLIIQSICQDVSGEETINDSCSVGEAKVGIRVRASVTWSDGGDTQIVELENLLYEWK